MKLGFRVLLLIILVIVSIVFIINPKIFVGEVFVKQDKWSGD